MHTITRFLASLLDLLAALTLAAWDTLIVGKTVEAQEDEA